VIAGTGRVAHVEVLAPGVTLDRLGQLQRCVRREVATWRFPERRGFANITIPYAKLHTTHPTLGPAPRPIPNV
jgi:hypothetical protein